MHIVSAKKKVNWIALDSGQKLDLPKTLFLTSNVAIVSMGIRDSNASGAQQKSLRVGYDVLSGDTYYKKRVFSHYEENLLKFITSPSNDSKSGFSQPLVFTTGNGGKKYWEKKESTTLTDWLLKNEILQIDNLLSIQNAIKTLHSLNFQPAMFTYNAETFSFDDMIRTCFHGDISPYNIVCGVNKRGHTTFKLIDYSGGNINSLAWTPGWASPEFVAYAHKKGPYIDLPINKFNIKFGRQKDAWALGLIFGSILRRNGNEHLSKDGLPCFSFISSRLKRSPEGKWDDSAIAEITQPEIDEKIKGIKEEIEKTVSDENLKKILLVHWTLINHWLTVNPEKRPTVNEVFIDTK
jgi:hypothetical protein